MADFELNGVTYRLARLDAMTQFHVSRRIMPLMAAMGGESEGDKLAKLFSAVGQLSDEDSEYVIGKCLADCRRQSGDTWAKVYVAGKLMFDDLGMMGMIALTFETLKENLADFFTGLGSNLAAPGAV